MAKPVKMMMLDNCPHCKNALKMIDMLKKENSKYEEVEIELIEESKYPEKTEGYDYWYVPTFFVDDKKIHEGVPTVEAVREVFESAIN